MIGRFGLGYPGCHFSLLRPSVVRDTERGRRAFSGDTPLVTLIKGELAPLAASEGMERIVERWLAKHAGQRFATVAEASTALEKARRADNVSQPQTSIAVRRHPPPFAGKCGAL